MVKSRKLLSIALAGLGAVGAGLTYPGGRAVADPARTAHLDPVAIQELSEQAPPPDAPLTNDARIEIERQYAEQNANLPEPTVNGGDSNNGAMSARNQSIQVVPNTDAQSNPPGGNEEGPRAPILASRRLSYQAVLTDNVGNALPGPTVNLAFRIYNGAAVQVEGPINVPNVAIVDGVVSTQIPVTASTFDGGDRFLGVSINGGAELTPRVQLTTVAYALRVDRVASAELDDSIELGAGVAPLANGSLSVFNGSQAQPTVTLDGSGSRISTYGADGLEQIRLYGPSWGELWLHDSGVGNERTVFLSATSNSGGQMTLSDTNAAQRVFLSAPTTGGTITLSDSSTGSAVFMNGGTGTIESKGDIMRVAGIGGAVQAALGTNGSNQGALRTYDASGDQTVVIGSNGTANSGGLANIHMANSIWPGVTVDGDDGNSGRITVFRANNDDSIIIDSDSVGSAGQISMQDSDGSETVEIIAAETSTTGAQIALRNAAGTTQIELDAEFGVTGDPGRIITPVLQITGGADLSEQFEIDGEFEAGMIVSIDENKAGKLIVSSEPYDMKVAGVVSGAGGVKPGLLMGQRNKTEVDGKNAVALTGRVYCWVDASNGEIKAGDMLTTSSTPGHAMKATDRAKSHGAIIGKAMQPLKAGKGLILVLVNLQ